MRKWEEEYKRIQSGELDTKISQLQEKYNNKTITREELKELESSKRIKDNMSKVDNVIEYKGKLEKQLEELKAEQNRRKSLVDLDKEAKKLDVEHEELTNQKAKIENKIKDSNLSDEEKATLQEELSTVKRKMNENQHAYSKNQLTIAATSKTGGKLATLPEEELSGKMTNISTKISKCNMICSRLLKGYSWDSIDIKLEQWQDRKLTSKKEVADKMRESAKEDEKGKVEKSETKTSRKESKENSAELKDEKEDNTQALVEVSEFDRKHPRIAKIKNLFKKAGQKLKSMFIEDEDLDKEENVEEKATNKKQKNEKDDFREYIKVVAEKGMKEADKERLETKKRELKDRLAEKEDDGREI